ncbi:NADP-dependent phosphogluconate dehydrogenase [Sodalis-like secondary symbiont of Drepanosiphum platanoidis]|uniref:NADP-dependent phosphogluconate dehydrogenase n=1 Tax=Sodalis-like secondary symbiont of Drepanosiphum platanoidis TaxID=2994493 RepID=UPI0034648968
MQNIGIVGMSIMGRNLALNFERQGYKVSIFNRTHKKFKKILSKNNKKKIIPYFTIKSFILSLNKPKIILLMLKAGKHIDNIIKSFKPFLEKGDIIIDGGNSFYKDTIKRCNQLSLKNIYFIGAGISGGEEGALYGPSIMPGGSKKAYNIIFPILKKISAKFNNKPCINYIGPNGSGHYLKMIHNGIEYSDMQIISESYIILKKILNLSNSEISNIFKNWNSGELNSYLTEITYKIFNKKDKNGLYIIDIILDEAYHKNTVKWLIKDSLETEEPLTIISSSLFARYLSSMKNQRINASKVLYGPNKKFNLKKSNNIIEDLRRSFYLSRILSYSQAFSQLKKSSKKYSWKINFENIIDIFSSGCIIRSKLFKKIKNIYKKNIKIDNLLLSKYFIKISKKYQNSLRNIINLSVKNGIPIPAFYNSIAYYDSYRSFKLPANLIQAQRDYFGSHSYKRIDKSGFYHTKWI